MKRGIPALDVLVCNLCYNDLYATIYQCKKGHSYCEACYNDNLDCNICRTAILPFRNRVAEEITTEIDIPCKWKQCKEAWPFKDLANHERNCKYKAIQCSLCNGFVTFMPDKIVKHAESAHNIAFKPKKQPFSIDKSDPDIKTKQKGIKINNIFIILKLHKSSDGNTYVTFQTLDYRQQLIFVSAQRFNQSIAVSGGESHLIFKTNSKGPIRVMVRIQ
ncbi:unnamed protein product [Blepharisma stoltei]|uniref:RING-type domain-containing protein n=1 Tax=Blepharisma stoltei TaxID=1481888 RepID=A0AAU9JM10_9CILI|nr:unnamed protein product [Blepharisma stoltei]